MCSQDVIEYLNIKKVFILAQISHNTQPLSVAIWVMYENNHWRAVYNLNTMNLYFTHKDIIKGGRGILRKKVLLLLFIIIVKNTLKPVILAFWEMNDIGTHQTTLFYSFRQSYKNWFNLAKTEKGIL